MTETWKGRPILTEDDMAKMNCPLPPEPEWGEYAKTELSRSFMLVCDDCKVGIWIGRYVPGRYRALYTGYTTEHLSRLSEFMLDRHLGHGLRVIDSEDLDAEYEVDNSSATDTDF